MEKIDGWEQIPDLVALDALIVLQNKRIKDPWNTYALEALQQLVIDPDAEPTLIYNYARLLKDNGRARLAAPYWERLASMIRSLPKNFQVMVCREVKDPERCVTEIEQYGVRQHPWVLKINPGDLVNSREVREVLHEWVSTALLS